MKKIFRFIMTILFSITLIGCSSGEQGNEDKLTIWGFYEAMPKEAADYYGELKDIEIDYQTIGWDDYQTKLDTVLGTEDAPDLLILDNSFIGKYVQHEGIASLEKEFGDEPEMQTYIKDTLPSTKGPGILEDEVVAIGWESSVGAFFYRTDLAKEHLNIDSVEEMEERLDSPQSLIELQKELNTKDSGIKLIGEAKEVVAAVVSPEEPYVVDNTFKLDEDFINDLELIKTYNDNKIFYTNDDRTSQINGAISDKYIGDIIPAWGVQAVAEYDQSGKWAIAKSPFLYTSGGSFWGMTSTANKDLVWDFLTTTFLNESWLLEHISDFGTIGNEKVTLRYLEEQDGVGSDYYGGQNITEKFLEIAQDTPAPGQSSPYDRGIADSINDGISSYVFEGTTSSIDETINQIAEDIQNLYPDLEIIID